MTMTVITDNGDGGGSVNSWRDGVGDDTSGADNGGGGGDYVGHRY